MSGNNSNKSFCYRKNLSPIFESFYWVERPQPSLCGYLCERKKSFQFEFRALWVSLMVFQNNLHQISFLPNSYSISRNLKEKHFFNFLGEIQDFARHLPTVAFKNSTFYLFTKFQRKEKRYFYTYVNSLTFTPSITCLVRCCVLISFTKAESFKVPQHRQRGFDPQF